MFQTIVLLVITFLATKGAVYLFGEGETAAYVGLGVFVVLAFALFSSRE